jgi:hypothetical protein
MQHVNATRSRIRCGVNPVAAISFHKLAELG